MGKLGLGCAAGVCLSALFAGEHGILAVGLDDVPGLSARDRGYVLSNVYIAAVDQPGACPKMSDDAIGIFYKSLPPDEQIKTPLPENRQQVGRLMASRLGFKMFSAGVGADTGSGPPKLSPAQIDKLRADHGVPPGKGAIVFLGQRFAYDSCTNPEDFPMLDSGNQPFLGSVAYGMDLDDKVKESDFTSPDGQKSVDNQLWRATGCNFAAHDFGDPKVQNTVISSAAAPTLIELHGVSDWRNADNVQVDIYASAEPLKLDAKGGALAWSSFDPDPDPRWHARVNGHIVDGVLTTDKADIHLRQKEQIVDSSREILGARLRVVFKPDGSVEGGIYGYQTLASISDTYVQSTQVGADLAKFSCPAIMHAVRQYADGYPDPATGQNTAISSALNFVGQPAFLIHKDKTQAANLVEPERR